MHSNVIIFNIIQKYLTKTCINYQSKNMYVLNAKVKYKISKKPKGIKYIYTLKQTEMVQ